MVKGQLKTKHHSHISSCFASFPFGQTRNFAHFILRKGSWTVCDSFCVLFHERGTEQSGCWSLILALSFYWHVNCTTFHALEFTLEPSQIQYEHQWLSSRCAEREDTAEAGVTILGMAWGSKWKKRNQRQPVFPLLSGQWCGCPVPLGQMGVFWRQRVLTATSGGRGERKEKEEEGK